MAKWVWTASHFEFFSLFIARPNQGDDWTEEAWGPDAPGRPGFIRASAFGINLRGRLFVRGGDGAEFTYEGFQMGMPGEPDPHISAVGDVYMRAESDDVLYCCPSIYKGRYGMIPLDQAVYTGPDSVLAAPDSYIVCLDGEIAVDGQVYGQFEGLQTTPGPTQVDCDPGAIYMRVMRRGQ